MSEREALKESGILEKKIGDDMMWCFDEAKGNNSWPKIGGRSLKFFPNSAFNKTKAIGGKEGRIENSSELSKIFEVLGLRVATQEEYILLREGIYQQQVPLWREELLFHREALKESGILEKKIGDDMIWCFDEAKGNASWPKIGGRSLKSFPNSAFNKTKAIGDKYGTILNPQELAKLFEVLGLRVKHPEKR